MGACQDPRNSCILSGVARACWGTCGGAESGSLSSFQNIEQKDRSIEKRVSDNLLDELHISDKVEIMIQNVNHILTLGIEDRDFRSTRCSRAARPSPGRARSGRTPGRSSRARAGAPTRSRSPHFFSSCKHTSIETGYQFFGWTPAKIHI